MVVLAALHHVVRGDVLAVLAQARVAAVVRVVVALEVQLARVALQLEGGIGAITYRNIKLPAWSAVYNISMYSMTIRKHILNISRLSNNSKLPNNKNYRYMTVLRNMYAWLPCS